MSAVRSSRALVLLAGPLLGASCVTTPDSGARASSRASAPAERGAPAAQPADEALDQFFAEVFQRRIDRSPQFQTLLGLEKDYGAWDDLSDAHAREDHALDRQDLERLRSFSFDALSPASQVSYRVFEYLTERSIEGFPWRFHTYAFSQMRGMHAWSVAFLINYHRIGSVEDAEAYISRLRAMPKMFAQLEENIRTQDAKGILPPKFVFPLVIGSCRNILKGRPFSPDADEPGTLLEDFEKKVGGLADLPPAERDRLLAEAEAALLEAVAPAYTSLIGLFERLEEKATTDDGAWKLPDGAAYYERALRWTTTTEMGPDEIHALGLAEVERIHGEMRQIMEKVGFEGSLQDFFEFTRTDPQFFYADDEAGRKAYLDRATAIIEHMKTRLPELFITLPKADLVVKRVEPFREQAAGKAFYNRPALDGSTPGYFYANLYKMSDMPKYQMEALAYHEGIPGHHMQLALTQELESLPSFRKFSSFTAHTEGWGLYSELVPKELGLYEDPYSDFGRLAMELWRACRLVVDTGIHHRRWTRERAIAYLVENTPNPEGDAVKAIERYSVMPSQATAYKVGMLEILKLRSEAQQALGDAFDIREFHEVVLGNGPVPLTILGELVRDWVASKKA